jgi:cytochrome c oxidase subunit 3
VAVLAHPAVPHHETAAHAGDEHHGSFMPLWLTIGTTLFLLGLLYTPLAIVGFLVMVASIVGWVREDVRELSGKPFATSSSEYLWGTIVLILSEVVIFGILFTFYFWSRSHTADFIPDAILHLDMTPIYLNTAVLISSGVTVEVAKHQLKKGSMRGFQVWLAITILLGLGFVAGQVLEYVHLVHEGIIPTTSVYGTAFYSLTGVHGLHVVAGVVVLATLFGLSFTGFIRKERLSGMEGAFIYWHFVDAIWVLVFSFVYLRVI